MPAISDFRTRKPNIVAIANCGRLLGRRTYWKLYLVENLFRVIAHSVLSIQISPNWWSLAVDPELQKKAIKYSQSYRSELWYGKVGTHGIYYIDLKDLGDIIRVNSNHFLPVIPDIDNWVLGIEKIRLPRNLTAHMNLPDTRDLTSIDAFYQKCIKLAQVVATKITLIVPN